MITLVEIIPPGRILWGDKTLVTWGGGTTVEWRGI